MNGALLEYDEAINRKLSIICNHQDYLHSVLNRYLAVLEKVKEGGAKTMGPSISKCVMVGIVRREAHHIIAEMTCLVKYFAY